MTQLLDLDSLKRSTDLVALLESYGVALKKRGQEYDGLCIAHTETHPSMQVYVDAKDGIQRFHCKSCGAGGTVIDAVMVLDGCDEVTAIKRLQVNGFDRGAKRVTITTRQSDKPALNSWMHRVAPEELPDMASKEFGEPVATWRYNDADGACLGYIARYATPEGGKSYRPYTYGAYSENVKATWKPKTWTAGKRPLYGLDLLAQRPQAKCAVVEGEKAADAARQLLGAMVCITWPGGANGIASVDWSPLTNRDILLIPDADKSGAGYQAMIRLAGILLALGCKVRILDTSDQPDKWDLADALEAAWTPAQLLEWAKPRISPLTSRELEQQRAEAEKKTMLSAQLNGTSEPKPVPGFDEDSSEYDLPPLEPEHIPLTIDVQPEQVADAPAIKPAKVKRHTAVKADEEPDGPEFSDPAMAGYWLQNQGKDWIYVNEWDKWMHWNGSIWEKDRTNSARKVILKHLISVSGWDMSLRLSDTARRALCDLPKIEKVEKVARILKCTVPELFDSDPFLLSTPGGVVDLKTAKLSEANPEHHITKSTKVTPDFSRCREEHIPHFMSVLARAHGGPEMVEYLRRWCYYILTGDTRFECFLFVYGPGGSGKSTFIHVLRELAGDYSVAAAMQTFSESKGSEHSTEIAGLAGARLVTATETEKNSRWNESRIKTLTGRDKISARFMRCDYFQFDPQFKLAIAGNHKPRLRSVGEEMRRRIHLVNFNTSFKDGEKIDNIRALLDEEMPGILAWAILGGESWRKAGMSRPPEVDAAISDYLNAEDTLGAWLEECCTVAPGKRCRSADAYASYAKFVESAGEGVQAQKGFVQELEQRGFERIKSNGVMNIVGLDVAPQQSTSWLPDDKF
jgi:putative DNA primase/helicase